MNRNIKVTLAALAAALQSALAFNAIHESSYNLEPRGMFASTTLSVAGVVDSRNTGVFAVPVAIAVKASRQVELGARVETDWGDAGDHVPYLVFGVKFLPGSATTFQADLLVPANSRNEKGFSLATHHRFSYGGPFYSRLAARVGFMEGLTNNDALAAFEAAFYPTLAFGALSLELGLIASSQTKDFEGNLAMDAQPGLIVAFSRASTLQASVALGLAGDHREEMKVKALLNHGF